VIRVRKLEDCIEWKVIDDGIGISREKLKKLFSSSREETGYGMFNVDKRIKYTSVRLWRPALEQKRDRNYGYHQDTCIHT
jgi:sensor histidine kinase YesM